MNMRRPALALLTAIVLCLFLLPDAAAQCVSLTTLGSASTQSFNTLSNTAGSTTNNLTLTGWFLTETGGGTRDNEQYAVDTGATTTGDTYSFGAAGDTDRALGGLQSGTLIPVFGACFTNNTGSSISSLDVAYTGEQWRLGTAARTDQMNFEYSLNATSLTTGTWSGVAALNFVTPDTTGSTSGALGARDGNAAGFRTTLSTSIPSLSIANGATFWIRWNDANASGADDGLAVDDFSLTPQGGGPVIPGLNINDVTLAEGNAGTTSFTFTVSLTAPAGPGGVTFDIATANNTAVAPGDYTTNALTGQTIPAGSSTYAFTVLVNGDTTTEANETFFVNVTSVTGANVGDGQGTGTINNDDVTLTPIHDIQGPGNSSPIVGASVTTRGIVTGVKNNGFFIQEPYATVDADPATSEGVFVFTSSAPPAAAVVGNLVQVTATVVEFVPSQDPLQPPLTELSSPTVVLLNTGNPLPAPVVLDATNAGPTGAFDQLEKYEGMRVSVGSLTVVSPTDGNVSEANASSTSDGVFYGVITGVPRPAREPGIQAPDPAPAPGSIPPIPRWDTNPETLRVDSNGLVGAPVIDVNSLSVVTGLVGPLDYGFRRYTILPDPTATIGTVGGATPTAATVPNAREFTVASYNLERFFDTLNDPAIGEPVLTAGAYALRLDKASLGIRDYLRTPDIVGIVEVENLATLQDLADEINADAVAASQPDPQYVAYLVEGNDVGGIDVGFLVKTAPVSGSTPRVEVVEVVQELDGTLFVNPDSSTETLNDRPPLRLNAIIHHANGSSFPVTVIVNHMRSLLGVDDAGPGSNGWPTAGARVRAKRQAQAEDLADLIQARQTANPAERIIVIGDFNAYEFNDGYVDTMNVISGTPTPDSETAVPGDGIDLVNPDLDNLGDTAPAGDRYSYLFDGQMQSIDHVLVNEDLINSTVARRIEHPRINADFHEENRETATVVRLSDHDPVVAYFEVLAFAEANLTISKTDAPDPASAGQNVTYTITVANGGPDAAVNASWSDTLPAGTGFVSINNIPGWTCTTPAFEQPGTVSCSNASFASGGNAVFTLVAKVFANVVAGTVLSNTATATSDTDDPSTPNTSTTTTTVTAVADLSLTKTDSPDPVQAGSNISYSLQLTNSGPSNAANVTFTDTIPANTTFAGVSGGFGGFVCTLPPLGGTGQVSCTSASMAPGSGTFTIVVNVNASTPNGTIITNTADVTSTSTDPTTPNTVSATTTVQSASSFVATKDASGTAFMPGDTITYTVVLTNNGAVTLADNAGNEFVDVLPSELTLVSASATSGTAVATVGTNTVTWNGSIAAAGSVTITINATVDSVPPGTTISNQGTANVDLDANGSNETQFVTNDPDTGAAGDATVVNVVSSSQVTATKTVSTSGTSGATVTYTVTINNDLPHTLTDNAGNEFVDVLPSQLTLVSASATTGTALATVGTNTVTWNGSIPSGGSVTITITAILDQTYFGPVSNQGTVNVDLDNDGTNETPLPTDDPGTTAPNDATTFTAAGVAQVPTLSFEMIAALAVLLAAAAAFKLKA